MRSHTLHMPRAAAALIALSLVVTVSIAPDARAANAPRSGAARKAEAARRGRIKPAPVASDSSRDAWAEARALSDQGRYDAALAVVERGLARDPDDVDLLWLQAGIQGWAGRHTEAVRLYEDLLARHPELVRDVRTDLATERLWAGDPKAALRDLDVRLEEEPGDTQARNTRALALSHADRLTESLAAYDTLIADAPGDVALRTERARVLTWMGRTADAQRAYRDVLARDPGNRAARLGLARIDNWSGLHRRAAGELLSLAAEPDPEPEVLKQLAFAHYWSGNPAPARLAVEAYLTREPNDREALDLERRLRAETRPTMTLGYGRTDDTDELRVGTTAMDLRLPLNERHTVTLGWQRDNVRDPGGTRDPLQFRGGIETNWGAEWTTRATAAWVEFGDRAGTCGTGEFAVTWHPDDRTRIDLGVSRDLIMTRIALEDGISTHTWVGGVDYQVAERLMLHADERQRFFSDDNRSQAEQLSARMDVHSDRTRRIWVWLRAQQLRTRRDLDHGYYDPAQYLEWGPGAEAEWTPRPGLTLSGTAWTGWQRERNAETKPYVNASGRIEWTIERFATLALEGGRSNSNLESATGYEQKRWAVSITKGF